MPSEPRDASSLLYFRDSPRGPEVYMISRHPGSPFLPGALVFLGGRVDAGDAAPELAALVDGLDPEHAARRLGLPPEQDRRALAHYLAALREGLEEGGLICAQPSPAPELLRRFREALGGKRESFAALLQEHGLRLCLDGLRYLDHWRTPAVEPRRYDTRFFVARAPAGQEAAADPRETSSGGWRTVDDALAGQLDGRHALPPPTLVILERLRGLGSVDAVLAAAPDAPVPCVEPHLHFPPGGSPELTLLLPRDARYLAPEAVGGPEDVVVLANGRWKHRF